jgi:hypothetical protein
MLFVLIIGIEAAKIKTQAAREFKRARQEGRSYRALEL